MLENKERPVIDEEKNVDTVDLEASLVAEEVPKQKKTDPKKKEEVKKKSSLSKYQKRMIIDFTIIFIVVFVAVFTSRIPFLKDTDFANIVDATLGKFFDIGSLLSNHVYQILETLTVVLFVWVLEKVAQYAINFATNKNSENSALVLLLRSFIKYAVIFAGAILILSAWGVDSTAIAASIGLIGLALTFGAQGLIEDMLSGLFLIFEKQFEVGDIVYIDDFRGKVHEMGIRTTKFLDPLNLDIKIIKNTDVKNIINASKKLSVAVCDMSIEYGEDLKKIEKLTDEFLPTIMDKYPNLVYEAPVYLGVQSLADSAVILRYVAKTTEDKKLQVQRVLNRELKLLFDENNINIPFPQLVLHKND
jgi:small conductance mechanosensitive channel